MCFYVISHDEVLAQFDTLMKAMNYARFVPDECFFKEVMKNESKIKSR